ncbi:MAG: hypothetical protein ACE5ER_08125, partial [Nitrospinaceae bacterium]
MTMQIPLVPLIDVAAYLRAPSWRPEAGEPAWVDVPATLPAGCYGIPADGMAAAPPLPAAGVMVFCRDGDLKQAWRRLFLVGVKGRAPGIRQLVRCEDPAVDAAAPVPVRPPRRKSFMTPTPLHIPASRISPIPGETHAGYYFKRLEPPAAVEVVPVAAGEWMHPMVYLVDASGEGG